MRHKWLDRRLPADDASTKVNGHALNTASPGARAIGDVREEDIEELGVSGNLQLLSFTPDFFGDSSGISKTSRVSVDVGHHNHPDLNRFGWIFL